MGIGLFVGRTQSALGHPLSFASDGPSTTPPRSDPSSFLTAPRECNGLSKP